MDARRMDPPQNNQQTPAAPPVGDSTQVQQPQSIFSAPPTTQAVAGNSQSNVVFSPTQPAAQMVDSQSEPVAVAPVVGVTAPSTSASSQPQMNTIPSSHQIDEESNLPTLIKLGVGFILLVTLAVFIFVFVFSHTFVAKPGKVTLQWWGLWEDPAVMQTLITEFEKTYPNVTVQYIKQDPQQYSQRLLTRIANGNGPDIFRFHNSWVPMFQSVLSPLSSDAISKQEFAQSFYPVAQQDLVKNGAIYGIPLEIDTLALFTNDQLFQSTGLKPPTNWTDFITAARALTVKDSSGKIRTAGAAMGVFDNITHAPDILSLLLYQNGADLYNLGNTKQNASDSLVFYTSFAQGDSNVWDSNLDPSINAFAKGNLGMYFGYSYDIFTIKALNPNLSFTVGHVPHLLGRNATIASYWIEGVSNKSKHQKESMEFMHFLSRKETEQKLYSEEAKERLFGELYARTDLADSLKNDPLAYPFISQAKEANSSFFAGETYDTGINAQMNGYLGNAVRGVLGGSSADSAINTLTQGVSQVLSQYATSK